MEYLSEDSIKDKKKKIRKLIINFFAVMIILTFFSNTINNFSLPKVTVQNPVSDYITQEIEGEGFVEAKESIKVYFETYEENQGNKIIDDVKVKVGDRITMGQLLVDFKKQDKKSKKEKEDLEAQLKQEDITCSQYNLKLEQLKNENEYNQKTWKRKVEEAKQKMDSENKNLDIIQKLFIDGVETKANLDKQIIVYDEAKRTYEQLLDDYNKALVMGENSIKDLQYTLELEKLKIEKINKDINSIADSDNNILSPCDGIVAQVNFEKGQMVDTSKPIIVINDTSKGFQFRMKIDREASKHLQIGDVVDVSIRSFEGKDIKGKVKQIVDSTSSKEDEKEVANDKKDLIADIEFDDLKGGETGKGVINKRITAASITVPNSAINNDNNGKFVWCVGEKSGALGNKYFLRRVQVEAGECDSSKTAILSGIDEDSKVVINIEDDKGVSDGCNVIVKN